MDIKWVYKMLYGIRGDGDVLPGTQPASVLVVIFGDEPEILMTKKSSNLKIHAGEVAFPGGKKDDADANLVDTALRETREEVGMYVSRKQIIARLTPVMTLNSGFTIFPFVALRRSLGQLKDNAEVESILRIPLEPFLKTIEKDVEHTDMPDMYTLRFEEHVVWGASARILKQLSDILIIPAGT